jgi:hypothetical protein
VKSVCVMCVLVYIHTSHIYSYLGGYRGVEEY